MEPKGSLFDTVSSTLFLNIKMVRTIDPNGLLQDKGLTSEVYSSPPLGLSPSLLSLKGTLLKNLQCLETLSGIYIYIYIYIYVVTRGTGKCRKE